MGGRRTALCLAAVLAASLALGADKEEQIWLDVGRPYDGWIELGVNPYLPVWGLARTVGQGQLDLIVVIDASRSTKNASGADLNRDGHVGGIGLGYRRSLWSFVRHPQTSSDPDDSILRAEIEAARRLVDRVDPERTRVGIVCLSTGAQVCSSLGNEAADHHRALSSIAMLGSSGRTNMGEAVRVATRALTRGAGSGDKLRDLGVVLMSDGYPTAPSPDSRAEREAIEAAAEANRMGIRIYTIGLGVRDEDSYALQEIARRTDGLYIALHEPGEIIDTLPYIDLRGIPDVRIVNLTTKSEAISFRVLANGMFSAYIKLREGKNRLRITAHSSSGKQRSTERWVYFKKRLPRTPQERRWENEKLEALKSDLYDRSLLIAIDKEMEQARREDLNRSLEVRQED